MNSTYAHCLSEAQLGLGRIGTLASQVLLLMDKQAQLHLAVCRLPCISFYPHDKPEGFGFIEPEQVIRGMHLIPAFHFGHTTALLPPSIARCTSDNNEDWDWDYVNM